MTTVSSSSCRPSPAITCSATASSTAARATRRTSGSTSSPKVRTVRRSRCATTSRSGAAAPATSTCSQNDADPDGDVIAILSWTTGPASRSSRCSGIGFRVTVLADAPEQSQFTYTISDGRTDPVTGNVVVAVSDANTPTSRPSPRPTPSRCVRARPRPCACWSTTTTPRVAPIARRQRVTGPRRRPAHRARRAGDLRVGQPRRRLVVLVRLRRRRRGRATAAASLVQVRLVPDGEANRPPVARPDVARTRGRTRRRHPGARQRHRSRRRRDPARVDRRATGVRRRHRAARRHRSRYAPGAGAQRHRPAALRRSSTPTASGPIGEVLIGVLPADGDNRPPTATNDTYTVIAGSDSVALDVLDQRLRRRRRSAVDHHHGFRVRRRPRRRCAATFVFEPPRTLTTAHPKHVSFTYAITDGRGGSDDARRRRSTSSRLRHRWRRSRSTMWSDRSLPAGPQPSMCSPTTSTPTARVAELKVVGTDPAFPVSSTGIVTLTDRPADDRASATRSPTPTASRPRDG